MRVVRTKTLKLQVSQLNTQIRHYEPMKLYEFYFLPKLSRRKKLTMQPLFSFYIPSIALSSVYNIPNCKQLLSLTLFFFLIYCLSFFPSLRKESLACVHPTHPPLLLVYWQTRKQWMYIISPHMQYLTSLLRQFSDPETKSICSSICLIGAGQPATSPGSSTVGFIPFGTPWGLYEEGLYGCAVVWVHSVSSLFLALISQAFVTVSHTSRSPDAAYPD